VKDGGAVPNDPSFSIAYDVLKSGKTACVLAAFGDRAVYIAAPGALSPAEAVWGFPQPKARDLETFADVRKFAEGNDVNGAVALVCDDASLIADRTVNYYKMKGIGGYDLWGAVFTSAIRMRDTLRRRGMHIAFTCHPAPAGTREGVRHLGGPAFPGQIAMKLPAAADLLLRGEGRAGGSTSAADVDLGAGGGAAPTATAIVTAAPASFSFGWPRVFRTALHPDWMQGSRYGTPDMAPMNLGEILRLAGFTIPRMKGLEWQESVAQALASKLIEPPGLGDSARVRDVLLKVKDYCLSKFTKTEAHAYWALRDGYDRAVLWTATAGQRRAMWGV
jgi:hypothetical protein